MQDLYICLIFMVFLMMGMTTPFVFSLGYVWVDTFYPHKVSHGLISTIPVAMIMAVGAFGAFALMDRRAVPKLTLQTALTLLFLLWINLTMLWAVAPDAAASKWEWAPKTVLFAAFIPFVFRSRVQIEAFLLVFMFSAAGHILPWGLKTLAGSGGYQARLGLLPPNEIALSESSNVAAVCVSFVPLLLVMYKHSLLMPARKWLRQVLFYGVIAISLAGAIGSFARTALVAFGVAGIGMFIRSRRKMLFGVGAAVAIVFMGALTSDQWTARISTVQTYDQESSALVRLLVWQWTLDFSVSHPFGGGFNSFYVNRIEIPGTPDHPEPLVQFGRAFHSLYFELLGEHGWVGLGLFAGIVLSCLRTLSTIIRRTRGQPHLAWCFDLSRALQISILTMLASGAFIGIAFQAIIWDLFALALCLKHYVRRAEEGLVVEGTPVRPPLLEPAYAGR